MALKRVKDWPILYKDILLIGDLKSNVGVCSLWTERTVVEKVIKDKSKYAVIGNLYSAQGINAMIRNIMANPKICYVVLWGSEMSLSGHSLLQLIKAGVDKDRKIINGRGEIEPEIPRKIVELFRKKVQVIDLRGRDRSVLLKTVEDLKPKKAFLDKPLSFKYSVPKTLVWPSEKNGFRVEADKVAKTWLKLLNVINRYGRYKHTRYSQKNNLKEVLNLTAVIKAENPKKVYFPKYLPFSKTELKAYYSELLTDRRIKGTAYNYGDRLRKHFKTDQIEKIKELLKTRPASKKMLGSTVDVKLDWSRANKGDTPCLTQVLGSVYDNKFFLTAYFRAQDMVHGWPRNTFALRKLQQEIAKSSNYDLGDLCLITHSAHIYSDDFRIVEELLIDNYEKELGFTPSVHFKFDPRGNLVVEVLDKSQALVYEQKQPKDLAVVKRLKEIKNKDKLIRVSLHSPKGDKVLKVFEGRTAQEVGWQITDWDYLSDPAHAMYIGMELQRAEQAIIKNKIYSQDPA